jgi:ABC-type multidrug transport system ATPase subunit
VRIRGLRKVYGGERSVSCTYGIESLMLPVTWMLHFVRTLTGVDVCGSGQSADTASVPAKKTKAALHCLDLTLYAGQISCLLGHNGAGKTTVSVNALVRLAALLLSPRPFVSLASPRRPSRC